MQNDCKLSLMVPSFQFLNLQANYWGFDIPKNLRLISIRHIFSPKNWGQNSYFLIGHFELWRLISFPGYLEKNLCHSGGSRDLELSNWKGPGIIDFNGNQERTCRKNSWSTGKDMGFGTEWVTSAARQFGSMCQMDFPCASVIYNRKYKLQKSFK